MKTLKFLLEFLVPWASLVSAVAILLIVAFRKFLAGKKIFSILRLDFFTDKRLIFFIIGAGLFYRSFLTWAQYYVWHSAVPGKFLLPPFQPINYFVGYAFMHFWLAGILILASAIIFYLIFKSVRKYREEIVEQQELTLLFLLCLVIGWPKFIIFVPIFFLFVLIVAVINAVRGRGVKVFWPLILAALATLALGNYFIYWFGLSDFII